MSRSVRVAIVEGIGTAILVIGGCGTVEFATGIYAGPSVGSFGVATAFGLSVAVVGATIGGITGGHVNPAVTLGMWATGRTPGRLVPWYLGGQLLGGLAGGLALRLVWRIASSGIGQGFASNGYGIHSPLGMNLASVATAEVLLTGIFVLVVLAVSRPGASAGAAPAMVGAALWLVHLVAIPIDNASINPARSLGVAPWAAEPWPVEQVWAFLVFPSIGGLLAAVVWRLIGGPTDAGIPAAADEPATAP